MRRDDRTLVALLVLVSVCSMLLGVGAATAAPGAGPPLVPTPQLPCGDGSAPETDIQGRVPASDHASGRAAEGYRCNTELVGSITGDAPGTQGGFKVERYVDATGRECAYYDTTLLLGTDLFDGGVGVDVLDMTDPTAPVKTASLTTPAMLSPHESMLVSQERGLLMATLGNPAVNVGILDIYDISEDCRDPQLLSSGPAGIMGHESGLAPDGMTFYSASPATQTLFAVDISDPTLPVPIVGYQVDSHGLSISADGNRAYVAGIGAGLVILDVSEVQARTPDPVIREVSRLDWESRSIPQNAIPITIDDHPYVVEIDEFGSGQEVGAARIIDIADETQPFVLSNMRLAVHQPEHFDEQADDVGNQSPIQGYAGHYCNVPTRVDPTIVACSMILSGLRVFSIEDPANPVEIAYYNSPSVDGDFGGNYAMSMPAFVPERDEIWYSDGFTGFHVVRLTESAFAPRAEPTATTGAPETTLTATDARGAAPATLPETGRDLPTGYALTAVLSGLAAAAVAGRARRRDVDAA